MIAMCSARDKFTLLANRVRCLIASTNTNRLGTLLIAFCALISGTVNLILVSREVSTMRAVEVNIDNIIFF